MIRERENDDDIDSDIDDLHDTSIIRLSRADIEEYCPGDLGRFPNGAQIVIEELSIRIEPLTPPTESRLK